MLERVKPPPDARNRPQHIAIQTKSKVALGILILVIGLPLVGAAIAVYTAVTKTRDVAERAFSFSTTQKSQATAKANVATTSTYVVPEDRPPSWQGTNQAIIVDINKDGTPDVIGRGRQVNRGDIITVLALDGATGATRWQSDPVGTYTETYRSPLTLVGELFLFATDAGEVTAFDVATGTKKWSVALPERISYFCSTPTGEPGAVTADDMLRTLGRTDGAPGTATQLPKQGADNDSKCKRGMSDGQLGTPRRPRSGAIDTSLQRKLDVYADSVVEGPGGRVLGATPNKGTRVTTLIAIDDKNNERWRVRAAKNNLAAEGPPRVMVVGDKEVCAIYFESSKGMISCFSMADGTRLWDAEVPTFVSGLVLAGRGLLVTGHQGITMRDLATGSVRWQVE